MKNHFFKLSFVVITLFFCANTNSWANKVDDSSDDDGSSITLGSGETGWLKINGKKKVKVIMIDDATGHPINNDPAKGGCYFYVKVRSKKSGLLKYIQSDTPLNLGKYGLVGKELSIDRIEDDESCTFSIN